MRHGQLADNIRFITDKGKEYSCGGVGGGVIASTATPEGAKIIGFYGTAREALHDIGCYYYYPGLILPSITEESAKNWRELIR